MKTYFLEQDGKIYVYREPGGGVLMVAQPIKFDWRRVIEGEHCDPTFTVTEKEWIDIKDEFPS